jgi:hypothetical protein
MVLKMSSGVGSRETEIGSTRLNAPGRPDMGWVLLAAVIVSIMSGLLIGRWIALIVPAVLIPLFYTGLRLGWWGYGVGDGWQYVGAVITIVTVAATGGAVVLSRTARRALQR